MEAHHERPHVADDATAADAGSTTPATSTLASLLLGAAGTASSLPPAGDLTAAVTSLATAARRKVLVPLADTPAEIALVRDGEDVLVSRYDTGTPPEVHVLNRRVGIGTLLAQCAEAATETAGRETDPVARQVARRLAQRARRTTVVPDRLGAVTWVRRSGGALEEPRSNVPLAFGFSAAFPDTRTALAAASGSLRADVHALLFEGTLWAFVRGRRIMLARGPIMLPLHRMLVAVRALVEAWHGGRPAHVRLRSGQFHIGVRLERSGEASVTLGTLEAGSVTAAALDVPAAALPILRVASEALRALVSADRSQSRNLRVRALRDEVRALRKLVRSREPAHGFVNHDPDRLRLSSPDTREEELSPTASSTPVPTERSLRFSERWRVEVDGLDASVTYLCGDRLVMSTPRYTLAVCRDTGEVLWAREGAGATALMSGTTLLLVSPEGRVELCDVANGEPYAHARITPRVGALHQVLYAGGGSVPPMAVLTEGARRLVAIDLRNGEPRWRFASRGGGAFRMSRAGRVLLITCGDGAVHALDVATGEVAWRFTERLPFHQAPLAHGEVALVASGEPGGQKGALFGLDLFSGHLYWQRPLEGAPAGGPVRAGHLATLSVGPPGRRSSLAAFHPATGELHWMVPDPGSHGACLALDRLLAVNAPGGRLTALDLSSGAECWSRALSHPIADEVPRRLEPVLRGGALFVPAASVHVIRPSDGTSLGAALPCDLVPDVIRVDERGWVYVAEESGHAAAYAPVPHLTLIEGGR